ncbi:uncharacterized protein LOC131325756 isoform X1 [Rhododendron vialii]|uniref:uncharacterized protein LOC131325756 isoform X1 n=1 Tax=Rhododendron vialii TaxID=182163 RepID=UPI00265DB8EB|nr:uncharacterized protein LOC131325756 isoform X1 [Rhododendron vialii]
MIPQENIVKKEEGFINEHLPDHVFGNSKKNEDNEETVNKVYNRKGSGNSMELKHWATFKKLGMDPGNKNNRAYQSGVLLSNSKMKKKIKALKRLGGSLIPKLGLEDYNTPLSFQALSGLSNIFHGLLSGCGDGQIILLNTNHNRIDRADVALQHPSSPQPKALPDGGEIVLLDSSEQKPSVGFDATNNRAYQSDVLVSNSEEKNTGEPSRRWCIPEGVLSLVDSTTSISSTYFDAPDNSAHFEREYQSGPIVFNSEKKDTGEGLNRECLTKSALSLDDSTKPRSLPDFDATENKAVKVYTSWGRGCWHSMEELEQGTTLEELGMDPENEGIIAIKDFVQWAGKLPDFKTELTFSGLLKIIHGLLSSCGDEQIIVLTTNHNHIGGVDVTLLRPLNIDLYIHTSSPQPKALPDGGEIVLLDSSEQKPLVYFDATNKRAYHSNVLVSNSEEKNTREASRRQCMPEGVLSLVDSTIRISLTDFDVPDNSAHFVREYQSGPIVFNSEKKDTGKGLNRECLTKSALSLDDSAKPRPLPDFNATENTAVKVCARRGRGCWHPMGFEQRMTLEELGMDLENEGIISDLLRFVRDREELYKDAGKDWKRGYLLYDSPSTDRSSLIAAMANFLEFDIYHLDLMGLTTISELTNVLVSIRNRSLIAIKNFDRCFAMLPNLMNELTLSGLSKIIHGLLSSCGDEQIIVLTTNHIDRVDVALLRPLNIDLYVHTSSPQLKALPDGGEIVLLDSSEHKPSVDFYATNNRAYPSDVLVSNSEEKNMREASRRQYMPERVLSLVDSTARISSMDFDASDNRAHLVRAYQSGPLVFNSEKKDTGEGLSRECLTKSVLSLDDSSLQKSLSDGAVTEKKSHLVIAYQSGPVVSLSDDKNRGEPLKRECFNKSIFGIDDLQQHSGGRRDDAAKSFCEARIIHIFSSSEQQAFDATNTHLVKADERGPTVSNSEKGCTREALKRDCLTNALSLDDLQQHFGARRKDAAKGLCDSPPWKSFEVLDRLPLGERSNNIRHLARQRALTHTHCVRLKKSQDLLRSLQRDCSEGLASQSDIGLPDGEHILSLLKKKIVRKTLKRKGRTMSVLNLEDHQQHFGRRWEDAVKFLGAKRICRQLVIHRETTAKRIRRQIGARRWLFKQSAIGFPDGGHILSLSKKKIVRKTLKRKCRNTSVLSLEDHKQHVDRWWEDAAKSHGSKRICRQLGIHRLSSAKGNHKQHGIHQWPFQRKWATRKGYSLGEERPFEVRPLSMDETLDSRLQLIHVSQFARSSPRALALPDGGEIARPTALSSSEFAATNNRAHLVSQDQSGSTASHYKCKNSREMSDKQGLEDLQQHFGCEHKHALKSLGVSGSMFKSTCKQHWFYWWPGRFENNDSLVWKSFKVQDNLPLGEQSNTRRRSLTHKHCVRLKKSQDLPRSMLRDCAGGLAAQSDIGLPDGGHILSLSEKKIVRKTLKRKCRTMSVLSLEDHQQHVGRRWEDTVKFLGARRICRQLLIHRETTAKRIPRQLGTRQWLFKQSAIGLPEGGHILYLPEKKIVRKTLKRKCRSISVLSLKDHKQQVDGRWEDAAKSHGTKRIRRQLVIHHLSTAKRTHKQHGIYQWPFQRSTISLPDGEHILSLSEKKIVRKTLKRKCRSMSILSLEDHKQHVDRSWEDAAKSHGTKRICRQLVIRLLSTAKRIRRQHGIHQRPFQRSAIGLLDGGHILSLSKKKTVRRTLKRKCRTVSVLSLEYHQHLNSRWEDAVKSLGAKRIRRQHGMHQWPFEQKWATRKGYSLGEERPFEVRRLSMDETLDSRLQLIHMSQFAKSSPRALALPDGGEIARPTVLSSSEFAATNNRAHLVSQDQSGSTASHYKCKNSRETSDKQGLEDLQQHFGCEHKHALKSLGVSGSMFKSTCKQHWFYWWPGRFENNEQVFDARNNRTHLAKADQRGPTMSNSKKENTREALKRECVTSRVLRHLVRQRTLTHKHCVRRKKSQDLPRSLQMDCSGGLATQSAIGLPDGGHILSLSKKKIVRKTLKRKCRRMSVLSLEDHKQHVDRRWEGAAKSHGAKRICRQLVIHRSSTAKHIRKEHGIHPWPFQRSFISLPDGGHILPLSEKKILRKTLKRKCRGMSVLSLVDRQQLVDRRWEDAAKNIGAKLICGQLVIHRVSIAKRIYRRHGIYHRWPFQQDWATMKGYSLGDERPVQVISLSTLAKLVSRLQLIYISWLGRFSPRSSALPGREIVEPIALSSSEFAATKNIAQHVRQDQSGSVASDSRNERTREQEDPEEIYTSITSDGLRRLKGRMNREDAAASFGVSVSTFKRKCRDYGIDRWPHVRKKKVGRPPDQHGEGNTSTARKTPSHNVQNGMEGELGGQNQEANVLQRDFMGGLIALNTESGLITVGRPPDQHGEKNTSTACEEPSNNVETRMEIEPVGQNQEANVFQRDFTEGLIALSTENGLITVGRPPDQHGEGNTSTARETPSHNVQNGMELVGQNQEANVLRGGFMGGQIALNTESGLITVGRPPDQHGEKNTSTACEEPSNDVETRMEIEPVGQNQEANVFQRDFTEGLIALSTENGVVTGSSFERASQVNDQSTWSTPYPNHDALVLHQPQITSMLSENRGGSIDWRNSLASQAEPFSDRHISGSSNLAFPTWSDQAAPSQHAEGQSVQSTVYPDHYAVHRFPQGHVFESINWNEHTNSLALQAEPFSDKQISGSMWRHPDQLEVQTKQFTAHPNPNALGLPQFQIASTQVPSANEDRRNSLTSQDEAFFMGRVSESSNLAFPTYSDAAAPSQPVATILIERQDTRSMKVKATYGDSIIKFQLPLTSGIKELMQEVSKTLDWELGSFNVDYKDEDGDWILMARDDNVSEYLQLLTSLGNQATKLKVRDKVPNTTNICETCGSLKQQRP